MRQVLLLLGVALLSACQPDKDSPTPDASLTGTRWMLTEVEASPVAASSYSESGRSYLEFQAAALKINGLAPCNSFGGTYTLGNTPGTIRISQLGSTRATCGGQSLEDRYLSALPRATSYEISADQLRLFDATQSLQPLLVFRAAR